MTPPLLEVDFTGITVPLSPLLSMLIAVALACAGLYALRRTGGATRLLSIVVVATAALTLGGMLVRAPWVGRAVAALPSTPLPLATSPALFSANFVGTVNVTNVNSQNVTITAITYNPNGFDYYLSVDETTCAVGQVLTSGASCVIVLRSLG
ncbi:MAG: hypothetical protein ABI881_04810 [Betaproteobacteria bacterium]